MLSYIICSYNYMYLSYYTLNETFDKYMKNPLKLYSRDDDEVFAQPKTNSCYITSMKLD